MRKIYLIIASFLLANAKLVFASETAPQMVKRFDAWAVYKYKVDNKPVCYALSVPTVSNPENVDHGKTYFLISRRIKANSLEPQFLAGYPLKASSDVKANIVRKGKEGHDFNMYTRDHCAWLHSETEEKSLVSDMKNGADLNIHAISRRGTKTSYKFSLIGLTSALNYVRICK